MVAAALIGYALDVTDSLTAQRIIATESAYTARCPSSRHRAGRF